MSGRGQEDPFPVERFSWVHPESPAAERWRELRAGGDVEALRRYEEVLGGPPGFCASGWRAEQDVSEHFPHVRADSRAAYNWRKLRDRGDGAGLRALEEVLERAGSAAEVRALRFCGCGCGRLDVGAALERLDAPGRDLGIHPEEP